MNQQKGFSLIEVLLSLMLATTLALPLIQNQWYNHLFIKQLVLRSDASVFLDQINESLYVGLEQLPVPPTPYYLDIAKENHAYSLRLDWFNHSESISRNIRSMQ